jgi:hypothetical protein
MNTSKTPIFRIFFISNLVLLTSYIPPKSVPDGDGINPTIVINAKRITENILMEFLFAGVQNISAIRTRRAAAISSNSCRITEKFSKLIIYIYPK